MWRGISLFRAAALVYALLLLVQHHEHLSRTWLAWTVLVVMAAWTVITASAYARPELRTRRLVCADLAVAFSCLFATAPAAVPFYLTQAPPLSGYWFAGAALAAGVVWGRRGAATVAVLYGIADLTLRVIMDARITPATARGVVLLLLAGLAVAYMARVAAQAERRFARAVALEARLREREQLARSIHDSVLQVLSMVSRRGAEAGGEAAEIGRMAGEQEVRLRALITADLPRVGSVAPGDPPPDPLSPPGPAAASDEEVDLRDPVRRLESVLVSVSAPATPVPLPQSAVTEFVAAIEAALANVERHCPTGTRAWILVEDEDDTVTVTVRDEGPGIPEGRLERAGGEGRLGVAQSIRGRLRDLGGTAEILSVPGQGTEVEMCLPRVP
ncbi:DUF5931 domain-containing protein [Nocardiopsis sp. N85]|uniref:MacS family sensor histidine kinase n=1 Tax=Nocardiopsis sp. N85 TaxID=3029400 RepID=UPI00237F216E|nr:DUF5931 domain-containing protein [Nocardiopsis sp. N85]MDE3724262.1 DUF5931 domain-containing protein [Nocardiopsis sp. N85]